ncbi:MAG: hypothetical protein QM638_09645, partial [Nocardioides sp.]
PLRTAASRLVRARGGNGSGRAEPSADVGTGQGDAQVGAAAEREPVEVAVSGSLAHLYLTAAPGRLSRERVDELAPALVPGLIARHAIGLVVTRRGDGALVVENADGRRVYGDDGLVLASRGVDPLLPYGPQALSALLALDRTEHVGDVILLGRYDPELGEVAAFEELVGSHGGLGGWQTQALFVHPTHWEVGPDGLDGLDVHQALVRRLQTWGLREWTRADGVPGDPAQTGGDEAVSRR